MVGRSKGAPSVDDLARVYVVLVFGVLALVVAASMLTTFLYICAPGEALVFSGRMHRQAGGVIRPYRVVLQGRATRVPFLEEVTRLDLRPVPLEVEVEAVFCKGGARVDLRGEGQVAVDPREPMIYDAIDRFLGQPPAELATVAGNTIEGHARAILVSVSLAQVEPRALSRQIVEESAADLQRLGLKLERFDITRARPA